MPALLGPFVRCRFSATLLVLWLVFAGFTRTGELQFLVLCFRLMKLCNIFFGGGGSAVSRYKKAARDKLFAGVLFGARQNTLLAVL